MLTKCCVASTEFVYFHEFTKNSLLDVMPAADLQKLRETNQRFARIGCCHALCFGSPRFELGLMHEEFDTPPADGRGAQLRRNMRFDEEVEGCCCGSNPKHHMTSNGHNKRSESGHEGCAACCAGFCGCCISQIMCAPCSSDDHWRAGCEMLKKHKVDMNDGDGDCDILEIASREQ